LRCNGFPTVVKFQAAIRSDKMDVIKLADEHHRTNLAVEQTSTWV
jgi:hypothetical protein